MRPIWLVAVAVLIPLGVVAVDRASAQAARSGTSKESVDLLRDTEMGGDCVIEMDGDGGIVALEASVPLSALPQVCRDAADKHVSGGKATGAEKEWAGGKMYWEVIKDVDGVRYEILMNPDGSLAGKETALAASAAPAAVVEAAKKAVGGGELVVCEEVTGPEAAYGEDYHVKLRMQGEVLRVSVKKDGTVVRTMRKMKAEIRIPK
jgi:hypothetical protein